jgi:hypothetical protein
MFHHIVRQNAEPLVRYLIWTMSAGGCLGITHGISSSANKRELRPAAILHDGLAGAIAGPWAPIFVPLVLTSIWPSKCPYYKNQNRK